MTWGSFIISENVVWTLKIKARPLAIHQRFLEVEIMCGSHKGEYHFIPKMFFQPSDFSLPFTLKRFQFPVRLSYSMTINKSQGQTFERVGIYLDKACFAHGQLYVAFSRARGFSDIKIQILKENNKQGKHEEILIHTIMLFYLM